MLPGQTLLLRSDASPPVSFATASPNALPPQLQPYRSQSHRGTDKAIRLYGEKRTLTSYITSPFQGNCVAGRFPWATATFWFCNDIFRAFANKNEETREENCIQ